MVPHRGNAVRRCWLAAAQEHSPQSVRKLVREYRQMNEAEIVRKYAQLLSLPNVASDRANILANASFISNMLEQRGFDTLALNVPGAPPVVYGELKIPGAKHTLLFYAHYDGQPVDKTQWASDPWQAVLRPASQNGLPAFARRRRRFKDDSAGVAEGATESGVAHLRALGQRRQSADPGAADRD